MIELLPEPELTPGDEAQIAEILRQCFPTDFEGRSFFQQRPHLRLVWREARIVAHMSVFLRAVRVGDDMADVIGIGDVATVAGARGRGHATALMEHCITLATASPAQFMILFGDRTLYDRAGFVPATNRFRYIPMVGARTGEATEGTSPFLRVRPLTQSIWPDQAPVDFLGPLF